MQHRPFDSKPSIDGEADRYPDAGKLKPDDARVNVRKEMFMQIGRIERFALSAGWDGRVDREDQTQRKQTTVAHAQASEVGRHRTALLREARIHARLGRNEELFTIWRRVNM